MIFIKTLQKILKQDLAHQSMSWKGIYWNKKKQESYCCNERWIRWKNMKEFVGLRAKTYSHLIDDNSEKLCQKKKN